MRTLGGTGFVGILLVSLVMQARAQAPGTVSLPTISVNDCSSPVVNVSTTEAGGTLGYDLEIAFSPSILTVATVNLGSLTAGCQIAWNAANPGLLAISIACTTGSFGSGTIASIQFLPAGVGSTQLTFSSCFLDEQPCSNPANGSVQMSGCPSVNLTNSGRGTYGLSPGRVCVSGILAPNGANVVSASNEISFDSSIFAVENCFMNSSLISLGKSLTRTVLGPGLQRVTIGGGTASLPAGILYACTLTIAASTPDGAYAVGNTPGATGPGGVTLPATGSGGTVRVISCGSDCDGSGSVSIGEVSRAGGLFLGEPLCNPNNVNLSCPPADVIDNNGLVSIGEVSRAGCLFLNGTCSRTCQ